MTFLLEQCKSMPEYIPKISGSSQKLRSSNLVRHRHAEAPSEDWEKKNGRAAPAFPSVHGGAGNTTRHSFGLRSFGRRYVNVASVLFYGLWCCFVTDRWQSSATQRNDCWWQVHILWCYTIGPPCARWLGLCNTCRRISLVPS